MNHHSWLPFGDDVRSSQNAAKGEAGTDKVEHTFTLRRQLNVKAGVQNRTKVERLIASKNIVEALAEARSNPDPWYRCQSLSAVAAALPEHREADAVLSEALAAAKEQNEPNRVVSVASWPIGVYVRRGDRDMAPEVRALLQIIGAEPNPVRRADALLLLLGSVLRVPNLRRIVLPPLLTACASSRGWKTRRILRFVALAIATEDRELASEIANRIPESRESRRAKRLLSETTTP